MSARRTVDVGALSAAVPEPICIAGRAPGVVAFHGFGGTTREIELAATVAGELGLSALARCLPGHGSHAKDLAQTRFSDWLAGAERAYQEVSARGPVIAAGISPWVRYSPRNSRSSTPSGCAGWC